ncbi:MAG: 50S ribosomal protein L11 methyltransferase [Hyphomicrobiaceae bacterium]
MDQTLTDFVIANTSRQRAALVPEFVLHLASEPYRIFQAADEAGLGRPFWAFAWPGGQAIARWLLDHPEEVAGARVLDIGSGSGVTGLAALRAGARHVVANDTNPLAGIASRLSAEAAGLSLTITAEDVLAGAGDADLILIGELFYEPEMALRVTAFLERAAARGARVLFADRPGVRRPPVAMEFIAEMAAALTPDMEIDGMATARLWRLGMAGGKRPRRKPVVPASRA